MKLAEILTGPEKWCQGRLYEGQRACFIGAVRAVAVLEKRLSVHSGELLDDEDWIRLRRIGLPEAVGAWNDNATWEEICLFVDAYDRDRLLNP